MFRMLSMSVSSTMVANASRTRNPGHSTGSIMYVQMCSPLCDQYLGYSVANYLNCGLELESVMPMERTISIAVESEVSCRTVSWKRKLDRLTYRTSKNGCDQRSVAALLCWVSQLAFWAAAEANIFPSHCTKVSARKKTCAQVSATAQQPSKITQSRMANDPDQLDNIHKLCSELNTLQVKGKLVDHTGVQNLHCKCTCKVVPVWTYTFKCLIYISTHVSCPCREFKALVHDLDALS